MKSFFNKRFEEEVLLNEKLRTTILACMFLFGMLYTIVNIIIFKSAGENQQSESMLLILKFQAALLFFEILTWLRISYKIKQRQYSIPHFARYMNSLIEICSPCVIIFIMSRQFSSPVMILHAPIVY